jgi:hypothetical protein
MLYLSDITLIKKSGGKENVMSRISWHTLYIIINAFAKRRKGEKK